MASSFTKATPDVISKMTKVQQDQYYKAYAIFLEAENAKLEEDNKAAMAKSSGVVRCKLSEYKPARVTDNGKTVGETKGGTIGIYGLGTWPLSAYKNQWRRALGFIIKDFTEDMLSPEFKAVYDIAPEKSAAPVKSAPTAPTAASAPTAAPTVGIDMSKMPPELAKLLQSFLPAQS